MKSLQIKISEQMFNLHDNNVLDHLYWFPRIHWKLFDEAGFSSLHFVYLDQVVYFNKPRNTASTTVLSHDGNPFYFMIKE